jgi:ribose transport system ATP-binding protein
LPDANALPAGTVRSPTPILAVEGVEKSFPGVRALKGVSFECRAGEIHALIGENGAGKSTLMRILAGVYRPDAGRILVDGREAAIASPGDSLALGIAMVYQDTRLVPTLDVAWNISLGHEPGNRAFVDRGAMLSEARAVLARIGSTVNPAAIAGDLTRAEQQQVEIARALARKARLLILDEPTSALTSAETEALFVRLRDLRAAGTAIVFISHRIPEVLALADRITVLKDGEVIGTVEAADATADGLVAMMVGRAVELAYPPRAAALGEPLLVVRGLTVGKAAVTVDFTLHRGEVLGFGGVQGAGQQETARALFGLGRKGGTIALGGRAYGPSTPAQAIAGGLVYVPADRRREGLFLPHGVRENVALPHVSRWARASLIKGAAEHDAVKRETAALEVRTPSLEQPVGLLSGGNQQKVVFARWFLAAPEVYVFDEPTQGVDVATKLDLYRLIRELSARGAGVIVVSSDVLELIGLTDRILVFSRGAVVDEVPSSQASEERIVGSAVKSTAIRTAAASGGTARAGRLRRYGPPLLLAALALLIVTITALQTPFFMTPRNFSSIATQMAPLALAALGQMAVILLGGIDLSVGPVISLVTALASFLITTESGLPFWAGAGLCMAAGGAVGLLNGFLVVRLRIPDLVATLSTFSMVQGLALILRPSPGGSIDPAFTSFILQRLGYLPLVFAATMILYAVAEALLLRGRIGARLYAVGSSEEAARVVGLPIGMVRCLAYVFSGLMAALAGLVIASRIGSGDPQAGSTFALASITAVVVGGTSVFGGVGTAVGTFLGALLIILIQNALNQLHVSAYWQYVWTGALTLVAVGLHALRSRESRALIMARARELLAGRGGKTLAGRGGKI